MQYQAKSALALAAAVALLMGCGGSETAAPTADAAPAPAAAAATPAGPAPLAAGEVADLCRLAHAVTVGALKGAGRTPCDATIVEDSIKITTTDGVVDLLVPILKPGVMKQLAQENVGRKAVADTTANTWSSVAAAFAVEPADGDYCVQVRHISPDGTANSVFVVTAAADAMQSVAFNLPISPEAADATMADPVVTGGKRGFFALLPREAGARIGAVGVTRCAAAPT